MRNQNIISSWLAWEFFEMPKFLLQVWGNYFLFAADFFSIPILFKTLFSPWHRYSWRYPNIVHLGEFFNTLISNIFSRIIGAIIRVVLVAIGIFFQIFTALAGLIIFIGWFLVPAVAIMGLFFVFII